MTYKCLSYCAGLFQELVDRVEIIEGEIAEAKFHQDIRAVVRLTAALNQATAEVRDSRG